VSPIVHNELAVFELRNAVTVKNGEDPPTLMVESGTWREPQGLISGVSVSTYGDAAPILSPTEARKLAKWLNKAADELEGANNRKSKPGSKPSHYEQDEEA
jgi:hypothetical protein